MSQNISSRQQIVQQDGMVSHIGALERLPESHRSQKALIWTRRTTIFLLFTTAYFISQFLRSANAIIAPNLATEFSLGASELGLITGLFFATFALTQIPLGIGLDRWGPRWVTSGLMALGVVGCLLFAVAPSAGMLALGRALLGVGMAGILMGGLKMLSQWYATGRFATMTGLLTGIGALGGLASATPLAWLNGVIGWRAVFLCVAVLVAANALAIAIWTRNTRPEKTCSGSAKTTNHFPDIVRDSRFWRIALLMAVSPLGAFRSLWAGPYLFDVLEVGDLAVGNLLLVMSAGTIVGFLVSGWLVDRIGMNRAGLTFGVMSVLCLVVLALSPPLYVIGLVYSLVGLSSGFGVILVAHARRLFPTDMTGQVLSLINFAGFAGTFFLQWAMGLVIGLFTPDSAGHYPPAAYAVVLLVAVSGVLVAFIWYVPLLLDRTAGNSATVSAAGQHSFR